MKVFFTLSLCLLFLGARAANDENAAASLRAGSTSRVLDAYVGAATTAEPSMAPSTDYCKDYYKHEEHLHQWHHHDCSCHCNCHDPWHRSFLHHCHHYCAWYKHHYKKYKFLCWITRKDYWCQKKPHCPDQRGGILCIFSQNLCDIPSNQPPVAAPTPQGGGGGGGPPPPTPTPSMMPSECDDEECP